MTGSDRLKGAFSPGRTALVPYLTAGYPTLAAAREVGEAFIEAGADVVEIGVPFSDSLADGPTIQDTATRALSNGADLDYCLDLASAFSRRVPIAFFVYYNNIFARGAERFLSEAAGAGVGGLMVPDLPLDEAAALREVADGKGVALCPLVAPTSTQARLEAVGEIASGFVYCVSVAGVTGVRDALPPGALDLLKRVRKHTSVPAALGFGIGSPAAAVEAAGEADGVVIGSKLMQLVTENGAEGAGAWLRDVREALDREAGAETNAKVGSRD